MEKKLSGNGVKVTQEVAKFIRIHNIQSQNLKNVKAREFIAETGIKAKKEDILQIIKAEISRQEDIRKKRRERRYAPQKWYSGRILRMLQTKKENAKKWQELRQKSISLPEALTRTYKASWDSTATYIIFGQNILRVTWDQKSDWDYYSKKYGRPKNTYTNRRVELLTSYSFGSPVKTYYVEKFIGPFIIDAIASFTGIKKIMVPKHLRPVQLNPYFEIELMRDIFGIQIYARSIAGEIIDYCAMRQKMTYHAETVLDAVAGLKVKLQAKADQETQILDYKVARKMGFCDAGIRQFVSDNELDIDGQYTRAELRNIVIKRRQLNVDKYKQELARMGIRITK
jgi:hypothetical protein